MNKKILRLAIPNILSNISIPLLSSVDTAIMGHLDKVSYIGAIAIGSTIFNFIYWAFGFLRMGTTGLTAQAFGKSKKKETQLTLARALSVALLFGIVFILFRNIIGDISFYFFHSTPDVETFAKEYFFIRIFAAPATLSLYAFHGWFLGVQNAKFPLYLSIIINALNIMLDYIFVFSFNMNAAGVALGTVIAQYVGLISAILLFNKYYADYKFSIKLKEIIHFEDIKKFFKVNADIFIRTLSLVFVFTFFTAESAKYGDNILAANAILMQLWMLLSYSIDGFAFSSESLIGKYYGKAASEKIKQVVKYSFLWGLGFGAVYSLVYFLFGEEILFLFTNNKELILIALSFFGWTIAAPLVNTVCFLWDGIYIGATATKTMRNSMLFSTILIFFPSYYLLKPTLGNNSLWLAMTLFMLARGITLTISAKKNILKIT